MTLQRLSVRWHSIQPPLSLYIRLLIPLMLMTLHQPQCTQAGRKVVNYKPVEMSRSETIAYFSSVLQQKASSFDRLNEEIYFGETFAEDLYHRIDNLIPRPSFIKYLMKTKNITDKVDSSAAPLLSLYSGDLNGKCSRDSVWNHNISEILKTWDGDRSIIFNDLEDYHKLNEKTEPKLICNRFRGLSCQYKRTINPLNDHGKVRHPSEQPSCQCSGDTENVGYYKRKDRTGHQFPDGCYIRTWRPCHHLSVDNVFHQSYTDWHTDLQSQRSQLAQMVFPVARPHRCHEGTYCMDLVPGMKTPVCWCTRNSADPACQENDKNPDPAKKVPVIDRELTATRREFVNMFLKAHDSHSTCYPELNVKIEKLASSSGKDPTLSGSFHLMKELVVFADEQKQKHDVKIRICDFRQGLFCDSILNKCRGKEMCELGKIHLGKGVCVANNGYACQTTEECVQNAKCKMIRGTAESVCQCETGYGDRCALQNPAFFAQLFVPITSGFKEEEYIRHQVKISNVLDAWEDSMSKKAGETCDPAHDDASMKIVEYFGNLGQYDPAKGEHLLGSAKQIIHDGGKLCMYTKFLRCHHRHRKCVPIHGSRILGGGAQQAMGNGMDPIHVQVEGNGECDNKNIPQIFQNSIVFSCVKGFQCRFDNGLGSCLPDCASPFAPSDACRKKRGDVVLPEQEWTKVSESDGGVRNMLRGRSAWGDDDDDDSWNIEARQSPGGSAPSNSSSTGSTNSTATGSTNSTGTGTGTTNSTGTGTGTTNSTGTGTGTTTTNSTGTGTGTTNSTGTGTGTTNSTGTGTGTTNSTGTGTGTTNSTAGPGPTDPPVISPSITKTPAPPRKSLFHEACQFNNDNNEEIPDDQISLTCDESNFLECKESQCECYQGLTYVTKELKCLIPLGSRCDEESVNLPSNMNYADLHCQHGACMDDNGRQMCRPETDELLMLVTYRPTD